MTFKKNVLLGLCHRGAYAALTSALVWIFVDLPLPESTDYIEDMMIYREDWIIQVVRWLDLPIAIATQIMPCDEFALDLWFRVWCTNLSSFFNHVRIGIPVYVLIFYLPTIYLAGRNWWRRRRRTSSPASAEGSGVIVNVKKNVLLGFAHRIASAALISALVWIFVDIPKRESTNYIEDMIFYREDWIIQAVRWLDLPIAAATQITPCHESALDLWFRVRCPELTWELDLRRYFFDHMRIGIPVYVFIFYLPNIYLAGRNWWRRRRRTPSPASAEGSEAARTGHQS